MSNEYDRIRRLTLEFLSNNPSGQINATGDSQLRGLFQREFGDFNDDYLKIFQQVINDLYLERIIIFGHQLNTGISGEGPW